MRQSAILFQTIRSAMCSDSAGACFMRRRLPHARLLHRFSMRACHSITLNAYFSVTESQLHMVSNRIVVISTGFTIFPFCPLRHKENATSQQSRAVWPNYLRGGVLLAMMINLALPWRNVFNVCLQPRQNLPDFMTKAKRALVDSKAFFCRSPNKWSGKESEHIGMSFDGNVMHNLTNRMAPQKQRGECKLYAQKIFVEKYRYLPVSLEQPLLNLMNRIARDYKMIKFNLENYRLHKVCSRAIAVYEPHCSKSESRRTSKCASCEVNASLYDSSVARYVWDTCWDNCGCHKT